MTEPLVEFVARFLQVDTSVARQYVVEGAVHVDGVFVDDPSARVDPQQSIVGVVNLEWARAHRKEQTTNGVD